MRGEQHRGPVVGHEGQVVRGDIADVVVDDAAHHGLARQHGVDRATAQQIGVQRKGRLDELHPSVVHAVLREPGPEGDVQKGVQARHADLLAHTVRRGVDARARAGDQPRVGDLLGGHGATRDHHQVQAAVHSLQEDRGGGPTDVQRTRLQRGRNRGVQGNQPQFDLELAPAEKALAGGDEDRGEVGDAGVAEDDGGGREGGVRQAQAGHRGAGAMKQRAS